MLLFHRHTHTHTHTHLHTNWHAHARALPHWHACAHPLIYTSTHMGAHIQAGLAKRCRDGYSGTAFMRRPGPTCGDVFGIILGSFK